MQSPRDLWELISTEENAQLSRTTRELSPGIALQVVERPGSGAPVIMLHGIWGWWGYWRPLLRQPEAFQQRPLWMADLRGHGSSGKPATGYGIGDYAADIVALLDDLEVPKITLIGHSLGALTALAVATRRPGSVNALVLEDPPLPLRGDGSEMFRGVFELKHEPIETIVDVLRFWRPGMDERQALESALCLQLTADGVITTTFDGDPSVGTVLPQSGALDMPTLVIQAGDEAERALRAGGTELLRSAFSHVEIVAISGTSHTVLRDAPDEYRRIVRTFVEQHG